MSFGATFRSLPKGLIAFGFVTGFASSVGQTFFIALSNTPFRETHNLSNAEFASTFGMAMLFHLLALTTFLGPGSPGAALAIPALTAGAVIGGRGDQCGLRPGMG